MRFFKDCWISAESESAQRFMCRMVLKECWKVLKSVFKRVLKTVQWRVAQDTQNTSHKTRQCLRVLKTVEKVLNNEPVAKEVLNQCWISVELERHQCKNQILLWTMLHKKKAHFSTLVNNCCKSQGHIDSLVLELPLNGFETEADSGQAKRSRAPPATSLSISVLFLALG